MRRIATLLSVTWSLALMAGCSGQSSPPVARSRPLVGVSLLTQTHAFYKDLEEAMRAEAADQQIDLAVVSCEMDPAKQTSQLEDFVTERVSAIIVAPCDSAAIVPAITRANQAGIPVFTVDIASRGGQIVSHVASDNEGGGRLAGEALARLIGGRGEIVVIDHPEVASVQDRTKGFAEALKAFPDVREVQRLSAGGQRARAMTVMEDMLQSHPRMRGVFAINDDSALGALSVLEAAKRTDVVIVGFDATAEAQAAIAAGRALKADVAQHPREIGKTAVQAVKQHLSGSAVAPATLVPVSVVDRASLAASATGAR